MLHAVQQGSGFFMAIGTGSFVTKTADIRKKNGLCMRAVFADIRAKKQSVPEPTVPERFVRQIEKLFLFRLDYSFPHPGVGLNVLKLVIVHNAQIAVAESFGDRHRNLRLRSITLARAS